MGRLPTGITVVTTVVENQLFGFTSNSFTSVSLSPPLVLFCLNKAAGSVHAFKQSKVFAISILSAEQVALSEHFATRQTDKFKNIKYQLGETGCPLLNDAIVWLECSKYQEYDGGDHTIFVGAVQNTNINNDRNPLIYFAKTYLELK